MSKPAVRTEPTPAVPEPAEVVPLDVAPGDVTEAAAVPPDAPSADVLPVPLTGTQPALKTEELFAHLSTALTMRMNAAPRPWLDMKLSTGLWLVATAVGLGMWIYAALYDREKMNHVWVVAGLEIALGLGWVVYLAGCRSVGRALAALVPPVTLYYLFRRGQPEHYRPLRFVLTGMVLACLPLIELPERSVLRSAFGWSETIVPPVKSVETPAARLRLAIEKPGPVDVLIQKLRELASDDLESMKELERIELAAELRTLLKPSNNVRVRAEAARTLHAVVGAEARPDVEALLKSDRGEDHRTAFELIVHWRDERTVRMVAEWLSSSTEDLVAKDTLRKIGLTKPTVVEAVLLEALLSPSEKNVLPPKPLLELLGEVGGEATEKGLVLYIPKAKDKDPYHATMAEEKLKVIQDRRKKKEDK